MQILDTKKRIKIFREFPLPVEISANSYPKHIKISMLRILQYKLLAYYTPLSSPL